MSTTGCDHARQARLGDIDEWACQDCGALMDPDHPDRVLASDAGNGTP